MQLRSLAELRRLVHDETTALLTDTATLDAKRWSLPSRCAGWDLLDVLVHLCLVTDLHLRSVENGLAGRLEPPWDFPPDVDLGAAFQDLQQQTRQRGPTANLGNLREAAERYDAALAQATEADLDRPVWSFGPPASVRDMVQARILDVVVHATDVRRPADIQPWFTPDGGRFAGAFALTGLPQHFSSERAEGLRGSILLEIDGNRSLADIGCEGLRLVSARGGADATITTDGGTWALLTWRGLPLESAEAMGSTTIVGDRALLAGFLGAIRTP